LEVSGHKQLLQHNPTLRRLIQMRNPYIDPINIMQVSTLISMILYVAALGVGERKVEWAAVMCQHAMMQFYEYSKPAAYMVW
jgi:hypothetical protein